jgi:hypothetical protein
MLYKAYFNPSDENSGVTVGKFAIAFINAVKKLPAQVDRFAKPLVDDAITAYNALVEHQDELDMVDKALLDRFHEARKACNVSVVVNKINHLFDMDNSEYCFNIVKDARASFNALTDEEKALVGNADVLTQKIEALIAAMNVEVDFEKTYADHFPEQTNPEIPPVVTPPDDDDDKPVIELWIILVIVGAAVVVIGAVCAVVIAVGKKKKATKEQGTATEEPETPDAQAEAETEAESETNKEADE